MNGTGYELFPTAERDAICRECLRESLSPLGLAEMTVRVWLDGSQPPVRRLFELQLARGAMKACWGFSLDFVPHIAGGRVRWHRTDKSARLDVYIDPRDLPQPDFMHGAARFSADLRALLTEAVARAQETWKRGTTLQGLLDIVREIRDRKTNHLGFYNYVQLPFAHAMLSAKVGDLRSAEQELEECLKIHELDDEEATKLKSLLKDYAGA